MLNILKMTLVPHRLLPFVSGFLLLGAGCAEEELAPHTCDGAWGTAITLDATMWSSMAPALAVNGDRTLVLWQQNGRQQFEDPETLFGAILDSETGEVVVDRFMLAQGDMFGFNAVAVGDGFHVYADRVVEPFIVHVGRDGEVRGRTPMGSISVFERGVISDGGHSTLVSTDTMQRTGAPNDEALIAVNRGADPCHSVTLTSAGRYLAACYDGRDSYLLDVGTDGSAPRALDVPLDFDAHVAALGDEVVIVDATAKHEVFVRVVDSSGAVVVPRTLIHQAAGERAILGANICTSSCQGLVAHTVGDEVRVTIGEIEPYPQPPVVTVLGLARSADGIVLRSTEEWSKSFTASAATDGERHYVAALDSNTQQVLPYIEGPPQNVVVRRSCPVGE